MPELLLPAPIEPAKLPFINRELSWLEFNHRVLEEAQDPTTPIVEKLKFVSIVCSNLDEFFMVRVGSLLPDLNNGVDEPDASGLNLRQQIEAIASVVRNHVAEQYQTLNKVILPGLREAGIFLHTMSELDEKEKKRLRSYFFDQVFPVLTPLAVDAGHPFPYLNNLRPNMLVMFEEIEADKGQPYALVELPAILPRMVSVKSEEPGQHLILLEDIIRDNIQSLFFNMPVIRTSMLQLTRSHDYSLDESEVLDLRKSLELEIKDKTDKLPLRLEILKGLPKKIIKMLQTQLGVESQFVFEVEGPISVRELMPLAGLDTEPSFKDPPFNPRIPPEFATDEDVFAIIGRSDVLIHRPFDSFAAVMRLFNAAADDPDVLAIKTTLYRIGNDSPVVEALCRAAQNGKQVTAVVELKARFDEAYNIDWTRIMQKAGVNVVYGFVRRKVHCKVTLVVRREGSRLKQYVHLSSGNYNSATARLYTDIDVLTADSQIGSDAGTLFNLMTGFNSELAGTLFATENVKSLFQKFLVAPGNCRAKLLELIDREIKKSTPQKPGRIIAKFNALVDIDFIKKFYEASRAGVKIDLLVRGICCLRPGLSGMSENIKVISLLDRFLEHSRIYYFQNGGDPEIYCGSTDLMPRNFISRVEILFPIDQPDLISRITNEILTIYLSDNVKARLMQSDGSYIRLVPRTGETVVRSQSALISVARSGGVRTPPYDEFVKQISTKKGQRSKK